MMREIACSEVQEMLPAYAEANRDLRLQRHLASCETCRIEIARYEEMSQGLHVLARQAVEPPSDLLPMLFAIPDADNAVAHVKTHVVRNRKAYLGGAAVLVAGAAGAVLWRSRRRLVPA